MKIEGLNRKFALDNHIIHDENHFRNFDRLNGLYGKVAESQNELIIQKCMGQNILDVGAGYGNLVYQLNRCGKKPKGIEIDHEKIERAKKWFGVSLELADFNNRRTSFSDIDTIIFREVLNHLDLKKTLKKAFSITKSRCLIFQGTEIIPLRLAKRLYNHEEFNQTQPSVIVPELREAGFLIREIIYRDVIALPLSGGWWSKNWSPSSGILDCFFLQVDKAVAKCLNKLQIGPYACLRVLIVADKPA